MTFAIYAILNLKLHTHFIYIYIYNSVYVYNVILTNRLHIISLWIQSSLCGNERMNPIMESALFFLIKRKILFVRDPPVMPTAALMFH